MKQYVKLWDYYNEVKDKNLGWIAIILMNLHMSQCVQRGIQSWM